MNAGNAIDGRESKRRDIGIGQVSKVVELSNGTCQGLKGVGQRFWFGEQKALQIDAPCKDENAACGGRAYRALVKKSGIGDTERKLNNSDCIDLKRFEKLIGGVDRYSETFNPAVNDQFFEAAAYGWTRQIGGAVTEQTVYLQEAESRRGACEAFVDRGDIIGSVECGNLGDDDRLILTFCNPCAYAGLGFAVDARGVEAGNAGLPCRIEQGDGAVHTDISRAVRNTVRHAELRRS